MHLGPRTLHRPCWRKIWKPSVGEFSVPNGTQAVTVHVYRCETCGQETAPQLYRAEVAFYCGCGGD